MSNPWSAITQSHFSRSESIPLFLVNPLSDVEPENGLETNVMAPDGDIPTSPLTKNRN